MQVGEEGGTGGVEGGGRGGGGEVDGVCEVWDWLVVGVCGGGDMIRRVVVLVEVGGAGGGEEVDGFGFCLDCLGLWKSEMRRCCGSEW